jgi:glycosyltransferase involved in cell wall biosynthesis
MDMRVCVDITPAIQNTAGVGRYVKELANALLGLCSGEEISFFYNDPEGRMPDPPLDAFPRIVLQFPQRAWSMGVLLASCAGITMDRFFRSPNVFHATHHLLPPMRKSRTVMTLYDMTFALYPQTHLPVLRWSANLVLPRYLRSCDKIIAISENTKQDAVRLYGIDPRKIIVTHLAVKGTFRPETPEQQAFIRERYGLPARFLLYVGTIEPRKNLAILLSTYRNLLDKGFDISLVIAGGKGWYYENFLREMKRLHLENKIILPGYVPDEHLPGLYSSAEAFVYPSLYEGFGFPVLEAMACGTPVICSNTSSLPEVAGDAAILLPPGDINIWEQAIRKILKDDQLRADMRRKGLQQAARFTWEKTARKTLDVYQELLRN